MNSIPLDPRLRAVAEQVRAGAVAADIGSDHGYLACYLAWTGKCPLVYACDIAPGPLRRTEQAVKAAGLSGKVSPLLSEGLTALYGKPLDDAVIAGMGGELIASILESAKWAWDEDKRFILQPMTKAERLRAWLSCNGFEIGAERAVISGRFAYAVIPARYTGVSREISLRFAWTGKIWDNKGEAARRYLQQVYAGVSKIAAGQKNGEYLRLACELQERIEGVYDNECE